MLVTADWVLPVSHRPIRDGGVLIDGSRISAVGTAVELSSLPGAQEHVHLADCTLMPGLVNAHTHLALTALGGLVESAAFEEWLPRLVSAARTLTDSDRALSARLGARECLLAGVTSVGDIVYDIGSARAAVEEGLGGTFFWEVLGIPAPALYGELVRLGMPVDCSEELGASVRCGISPHSPYTSGPGLLHAVRSAAEEAGMPVAVHLAESPAEVALIERGEGPLVPVAERVIGAFETPGTSPVEYLEMLGALDGATVIHAGEIGPDDVARLAANIRGAVACPRSNLYLRNRVAPVMALRGAGVPVGLGTDSSASNHDLDLFEEARVLKTEQPGITDRELITMLTSAGALAIGVEDRAGSLEPGMLADLAAFRTGPTDDPEAALVAFAGASRIDSVLTRGVWRVRDGRLVAEKPRLESQNAAIAERAARELRD